MFSHVMLGANDMAASKAFYDAALGALGHAAGMANGGTAIEDAPGVRGEGSPMKVYLAYLRDPAGNKVCALHMMR